LPVALKLTTCRGEHIHHGYFLTPEDTKEKAQLQLIDLLLERSALPKGSKVLDVGCGIGGTSRFLAKSHDCAVTGVTISGRQVEIAKKITLEAGGSEPSPENQTSKLGSGSVRFIELDAEKMGDFFTSAPNQEKFDCVWISEAMSHLPNKALFFQNTHLLLKDGGKLVVADWFKNEGLTEKEFKDDISPIEDGMLLPPLCTQADYVNYAKAAGLKAFAEPFDISKQVSKTW
jgi:tocopherol O-methyltransferase